MVHFCLKREERTSPSVMKGFFLTLSCKIRENAFCVCAIASPHRHTSLGQSYYKNIPLPLLASIPLYSFASLRLLPIPLLVSLLIPLHAILPLLPLPLLVSLLIPLLAILLLLPLLLLATLPLLPILLLAIIFYFIFLLYSPTAPAPALR